MNDGGVRGWVLPEWPALSRRPLILGLPFGMFGVVLTVGLMLAIGLHLYLPALVLVVLLWTVGAALTWYDPWMWEIALGAVRQPSMLRSL